LAQLAEERMAVKDNNVWRVPNGNDIINMNRPESDQVTEQHIREMMRFCVQK
jgi:hypothetical protein